MDRHSRGAQRCLSCERGRGARARLPGSEGQRNSLGAARWRGAQRPSPAGPVRRVRFFRAGLTGASRSPNNNRANQLTRRDFVIRTAAVVLLGTAPALRWPAERASRRKTLRRCCPYSLVDTEILLDQAESRFDLSGRWFGSSGKCQAAQRYLPCAAARGAVHTRAARSTRGSSVGR